LAAAASRSPGKPALLGRYDYQALSVKVAGLCGALQEQGLAAGATLAVQSRDPQHLTLMLYAALLADFTLLPLDPCLPAGLRRGLCAQAQIERVLVEHDIRELLIQPSDTPPVVAGTHHPRLLIASSGSTGAPKLIALDDRQLAASVKAVNACLRVSSRSVWLACLPLVHIGGLMALLRCLRAAAAVVLHQGFDAGLVMADLTRRRVTHISLVPTMLARLLETGIAPPASLEVALIGGAPLSRSLARRALAAGWPLWVSYGMTETTSMLAGRRLDDADANGSDGPPPVGPPLPGYRLRVVDEQGRPSTGGGVIEVAGAAVAASDWLRTGDRGLIDASGALTVLGRADEVINSGGEKVQPEQVEDILSGCPGVLRAAVTGRPDPLWGQRVVAFYCGDIDEAKVERWCRRYLLGAMRPREVRRVPALPLTANGKLDRTALRGDVWWRGGR
jgi:O-succinylbenzoic acid--CoA ligase